MTAFTCSLLFATIVAAAPRPAAEIPLQIDDAQFRIEVPDIVLAEVPVKRIRMTAHHPDGRFDGEFAGRPLITGIRLVVDGVEKALPPFAQGVLELETDLLAGRRVYVTGPQIVVDPESPRRGVLKVARIQRWFALVPPLLAVLLALWLRNIIIALFAAVWSGAVILNHGNFFLGFVHALDTYLVEGLVQPHDPVHSHMMIVLFTMFLGAIGGVVGASGGGRALTSRLARFAGTRERAQLITAGFSGAVFFDDVAGTALAGGITRPLAERARISPEKLAFLINSTAVAVAGVAVLSTWAGVQLACINDAYTQLYAHGHIAWNAGTTLLASLAYQFYPLLLLGFVGLVAFSGRDFGPMRSAEERMGASPNAEETPRLGDESGRRELARNALVPLGFLLALVIVGIWWTGHAGVTAANAAMHGEHASAIPMTAWNILTHANIHRVLFLSTFLASASAVAVAAQSGALSLRDSLDAWTAGAKNMFTPIVVLVLAWGVSTLCDAEHLDTAAVLIELGGGHVHLAWMPAMAFLLSAAVAFATGSAWGSMALLAPLCASITFHALHGATPPDPQHHYLLATLGAVFAGAMFGGHCSPLSLTTILSSAVSGCEHLDHVATQFPYAAVVAVVALLFGYVPMGLGYTPLMLLPIGLGVLLLVVQFVGAPLDAGAPVTISNEPEQTEPAPARKPHAA